MVAVGPAAEHVQGQVDLGGRAPSRISPCAARLSHGRADAASAAVGLRLDLGLGGLAFGLGGGLLVRQAVLDLARIFGRSSGSGFRSRAWFHWNFASSLRPTRQ